MVLPSRSKNQSPRLDDDVSYEQKSNKFKQSCFEVVYGLLIENQNASAYPYYFITLLEHLGLLWFVLHPGLNIFGNVYLLNQFRMALKFLNFYEFLEQNVNLYMYMSIGAFIYVTVQFIVLILSVMSIIKKYEGQFYKYLRKLCNLQFLFTVKVLSGPFLGLAVNILYCTDSNPYHTNQICYNATYIIFCILAALLLLSILCQNCLFTFLYYIKNPLSGSYLAQQNRYFCLSKTIIKLLMPIYFALDGKLLLALVFLFTVTGLWGAYLFWHRLFSVHNFEQRHFYVEYFMEATVFWMAVNNILSYYIEGPLTQQKMSFVYALFSALLVALLLANIERTFQQKFVQQCLQSKVKKQNMQKFVFILIYRFLHMPTREARLTFKVYSKIILKILSKTDMITSKADHQPNEREQVYRFLCLLVDNFLLQCSSVILKTLKCYLLCFLGQKSYGIHQSLELQEQRLGVIEQFMLFQFRKGQDVFATELTEKISRQFVKFYRFHQELGQLEGLVQVCALNNLEYWEQLCESDPSLAKLRNLATLYSIYFDKITKQYDKVSQLFPQSLHAVTLYLNFLMNVGVDIRQALRIKQKVAGIIEAKAKSLRVTQNNLGQDQQVSIVTLDSIGSNLGVVLNCNSHVKQQLGFDKAGIIGKNITKLMPKIYAQLHNEFMLSFIRSQNSHLRPSDKKVVAINRNSLLVQLKLTVRMMTSSQSSLAIVGFMRKAPTQPYKGLLMFSASTGEVLGVDAYFLTLMNKRLTGKQVVQQQLRLAALMPEINIQQLEKDGSQNTLLQVGNMAEQQGVDLEMTKQVHIQLRQTKIYQGIKIGFLLVSEQNKNNLDHMKMSVSHSDTQVKRLATPQQISLLAPQKDAHKQRISTCNQEVSINISDTDQAINQKSRQKDGLNRQLPMARKLQDYIKSKEGEGVSWLIRIIYIICILGCTGVILFIFLSHNSFIADLSQMYGEMRSILDMNFYQAQINLLTERIWSIQEVNFNSDYNRYIFILRRYMQSFSKTFYDLITLTQKYPYNLQFNSHNQYNFIYSKANNTILYPFNVSLLAQDGIANYISSITAFLMPQTYDNSTPSTISIMQRSALYIRLNGQSLISDITNNALKSYNSMVIEIGDNEVNSMISLKSVLFALSVACILSIAILGHYINKINVQVVQLYRKVRLWDINQLVLKCNKFLEGKGVKNNKKRTSSLLKIFPLKTLIDIIQGQSFKQKQLKSKALLQLRSSKQTKIKQKILNKSSISRRFSPQCMTPDALLTPAQPIEGAVSIIEHAEGEQQLLMTPNEPIQGIQPMVRVQWQFSSKRIIIGVIVVVLLLVGVIGLSLYLISADNVTMQTQINRLKLIGATRKSLNFLSYYAARVLNNPNDADAYDLLVQEIKRFYRYSDQTYLYLGDPYPVLKKVYTAVETLQQWLTIKNTSTTNILIANYSELDAKLQDGSRGIDQLDKTIFHPQYDASLNDSRSKQLIFALVLIGMMIGIVGMMHFLYMQPIQSQCRHSINMLRILPAWILQRNEKATLLVDQ